MRTYTLGISTCPNDTFIFDAMLNGKIDTLNMDFECELTDVEELNKKAFNTEVDITKLSYHAYAYVSDNYILLNSGSALAYNNGPLLVAAGKVDPDHLAGQPIAIPGRFTTANLLMGVIYPGLTEKHEYLFSDIEDIVLKREATAGLLIHENRFTYRAKGLHKIADLGEVWKKQTGMPIPLGGIAIKRTLGNDVALKVQKVLASSIDFAYKNPGSSYDFVRKYAASMEPDVMQKHIKMYVNDFSLDLGATGRDAVRTLYEKAEALNAIPHVRRDIFAGFHSSK
ncbi:MAG: 1,4-dihydroxy-6-naphthoate synthase [Bacteroidota bacterium]|nr:1,4-dihydroxy-6-naphthoate synthase [Bacteroidota bacterium]